MSCSWGFIFSYSISSLWMDFMELQSMKSHYQFYVYPYSFLARWNVASEKSNQMILRLRNTDFQNFINKIHLNLHVIVSPIFSNNICFTIVNLNFEVLWRGYFQSSISISYFELIFIINIQLLCFTGEFTF